MNDPISFSGLKTMEIDEVLASTVSRVEKIVQNHYGLNSDPQFLEFQNTRRQHWAGVALNSSSNWGRYYHDRLTEVYQQVIQPNLRVLEVGCGQGDLLAAVKSSHGVGIDFAPEMIARAQKKHPQLHFHLADAHLFSLEDGPFDVIILSDILNDVWDVHMIFENLKSVCHPGTRIIINTYSRLWELPLTTVRKMGLANPVLSQNWLTIEDIQNLLEVNGFEVIRSWQEVLFPLGLPLVSKLMNRVVVKIWPFHQLALSNFLMARPCAQARKENPGVTIVVPARNEEGNIERIFASIPEMGCDTELIFVEGNSRDNTYAAIEKYIETHPDVRARLFRQKGVGKGDAVRLGFDQASEDILIILDADLTVPTHYLPRFYDAIASGSGEFINGTRLVYPMEKEAMQFLNLLGNKFFSLLFSWLLGQPVKDTLCGTKVLWREDYRRIAENRAFFGDFDPFGDFDLLFGAAKLGLKIVDVPVRYRERTYGTTNISRWKHGMLLLRMAAFAAGRLKFI